MFCFTPFIFCPRWLSWTNVQVRFSSLLLVLEYADCANQTSCTDMPLDDYYPVLVPVTNVSTVWSSKVATLALTNSLGKSTHFQGLLSHCDCKNWLKFWNFAPPFHMISCSCLSRYASLKVLDHCTVHTSQLSALVVCTINDWSVTGNHILQHVSLARIPDEPVWPPSYFLSKKKRKKLSEVL